MDVRPQQDPEPALEPGSDPPADGDDPSPTAEERRADGDGQSATSAGGSALASDAATGAGADNSSEPQKTPSSDSPSDEAGNDVPVA